MRFQILKYLRGATRTEPLESRYFGTELDTTIESNDTLVFSRLPDDLNAYPGVPSGRIHWRWLKITLMDKGGGSLRRVLLTNNMTDADKAELTGITGVFYEVGNITKDQDGNSLPSSGDPYRDKTRIVFSEGIPADTIVEIA